jgi:hypothetical protein
MVFTVDGIGYGYTFATDALTTLPLTGPQTFGQVGCINGRIITNEPGTRHWWFSGHYDALVWDPVAYYEAEGRADNIVTLLADHREIIVGGTQSVEVWVPSGRPFPDPQGIGPFMPMTNVFLEQGIETPYTLAALDNVVTFLGGSPRGEGPVWTLNGYQPVRVSTHALESAMAGMPTVGDAIAFTARHGGHAWYFLDFVSGGQTWSFDTATQAWNELVTLADDGSFLPFPCHTHCSAFAEHLFGDRNTGALYLWDPKWGFYGNRPIYKERTGPHIRNDQKRMTYSKFELVMETGIGLDGNPPVGVDPQVMMSYSDDGGHSWSQPRWRSAGRIGATRQQVVWRQLGQSRQRAFRVVITDPVFVAILGASVDAS